MKNMLLIADSGSTKTDWVLVNGEDQFTFTTRGFNPYYTPIEEMATALLAEFVVQEYRDKVDTIYFYGSGCSNKSNQYLVKEQLLDVFPNAEATVDHDLKAAALATYNGSLGIACILGTGSNCCSFDGQFLEQETPSLGYLLGDEGSGTALGKKLIRAFLYGQLPNGLTPAFGEEYPITQPEVLDNIYNKERPNAYLAQFVPFLKKHIQNPYIQRLVKEELNNFVQQHILAFEQAKEVPIHCVGSIAFHFSAQWKEVLEKANLNCGSILQKPIDGLVAFHTGTKA